MDEISANFLDLESSDYYLFAFLLHLSGKRFSTGDEVKNEMEKSAKRLVRYKGIKIDTCIDGNGD